MSAMRVNPSQSRRVHESGGTSAGYPPRYPSESNSLAASTALLVPARDGHIGDSSSSFPLPRPSKAPSPTNGTNASSSVSYDGKRMHRANGPSGPELDLNGSTHLRMQSQRAGSGSSFLVRDGILQTSPSSSRPPSGQRAPGGGSGGGGPLSSHSRDGTLLNGVLLGSLAGYLPVPAVALANASAAQQQSAGSPHADSPRVNSMMRSDTASAGPPDVRTSSQSITVLKVTRNGQVQDDTRPPSSASMHINGAVTTEDVLGGPAVPPRRASFNQVDSGRPRAPPPRVQWESIVPIPLSDASTSTNLSAPSPNGMPPSSRKRQQSPQQQQRGGHHICANTSGGQSGSRASTAAPTQQSLSSPAPPSVHNTPASTQNRRHQQPSPRREQHHGELVAIASAPRPAASANGPSPSAQHHHGSGRVAVLHHRPSPAAVARPEGDGVGGIRYGPPVLQVSTTTLTKTCKKVRYLRPDDLFDPDAPDPTDKGGLTEAEEEALLDPVNFTRAADGVAGLYPMLLRRPSAQGGDLLRGRRGSTGQSDDSSNGGLRPTFLLDDGNRWARETNRPTVATTSDPTGVALTQLPSPCILMKGKNTRSREAATMSPFPAYQKVVDEESGTAAAGGYLLQRHVQQMATGKQLVEGTVFQPPPMTQRQRERREREEEEDRRTAAAAAKRNLSPSSHKTRSPTAAEVSDVNPRRGPTDALYEEIIRRANQNRRAALPTKVLVSPTAVTAAGGSTVKTPMPPLVPSPPAAGSSAGRQRGRQYPNSAEPTPLHQGSGVRASPQDSHVPHSQKQQGAHPPPRSSSQQYITSTYIEATPNGSDTLGPPQDYYYTPITEAMSYAPAQPPPDVQHQQQQRPLQVSRPPLAPPSPSSLQSQHSSQRQRPPPSAQRRMSEPLQVSPPLREHSPSSEATSDRSVHSTTMNMPGYTTGRFSKYNLPGTVVAPPSPVAAGGSRQEETEGGVNRQRYHSGRAPERGHATGTRPAQLHPPLPQQQEPSMPSRSAAAHRATQPSPAVAPAALAPTATNAVAESYPSPYEDDDYTDDREDYANDHSTYDEESCPFDEDEPVTDAGGGRTVGCNKIGASNSAALANNAIDYKPSSGSVGTVVQRSLLEQYANGEDEGSQDTLRGMQHARLQPQQRPRQQQQQHAPAASAGQVARDRALAPPPTTSSSPVPAAASKLRAKVEEEDDDIYEEAPSLKSCDTDTDTQPIAVSERGCDELDEDDDLVKKGPLVLKLGDEVYAEEGYVDEEGEAHEEEEGEE
ncbi:hypothetical protein ABL78_6371 [Leptomonas seymouri]|uniref:Uncharacterized protein n=1 Tax=Leptomonas seymouri TaxID=5684 RepID=A0A0N1HTU6_LEPSE|nr:hypothetical protein ABL78_6371 [Leptomonas seymouri]|eukprot:KPI84581.1 hypothetical protein ABL78_6371 [Leptomonas seymouri]